MTGSHAVLVNKILGRCLIIADKNKTAYTPAVERSFIPSCGMRLVKKTFMSWPTDCITLRRYKSAEVQFGLKATRFGGMDTRVHSPARHLHGFNLQGPKQSLCENYTFTVFPKTGSMSVLTAPACIEGFTGKVRVLVPFQLCSPVNQDKTKTS